MKKELQFQNDYLLRKDPKLMSLGELDAYLSSKAIIPKLIDNSNITNSPLRNDTSTISNPFIGERHQHPFIINNQNNCKDKPSISQINSCKCGNDYIKSLQDKILSLTIENNEIKSNFIQVSEILSKEREESNRQSEMLRNTKGSCNSNSNSYSHMNELNDYKNKVKCLFQENKQLNKLNEELNRKLLIANEKNYIVEQERKKEYEDLIKQKELEFNKLINDLNSQINQLKIQLTYINQEQDNVNTNCNNNISHVKKIKHNNHLKKVIPYSNYSKISPYGANNHITKTKQITSLTPLRNNSNKPQRHINEKVIYKSPYEIKMEALTNKKVKKIKKKKISKQTNITNTNCDIENTYTNINTNSNTNYNPSLSSRSYNNINTNSNINHVLNYNYSNNNNNIQLEQSKYDYDLKSDNLIVNPKSTFTSSLDRLVVEKNPIPVYSNKITDTKQSSINNILMNNSDASFQMNCFSSQPQQGYDNEKERLNQLNQVVIRIQLLEQNIEQLKSSYQAFLSVIQNGVTQEEEAKIKESMNKISSTLEEKTYKLLSLKKEQQDLLKKSLYAKNLNEAL